MLTRSILSAAVFSLAACATAPSVAHDSDDALADAGSHGHPVKVMIVTMFGPEGQAWLDKLGPWKDIKVAGLSPDYPAVHCNKDDVCVVTTGMGYANAASTIMALTFSNRFDLRKTYFLISGIAGVSPKQGTLGTAAWSRYLVDFSLQWEIDARDIPPNWNTGYLGINTKNPNDKPPLDYRTEVFQLNGKLTDAAFALSRNVTLADSTQAQAARAKFNYAPANQPPAVMRCDTLSGNTWFSGTRLGERADQWAKILTDNKGVYCMTAQEDSSSFEALKRAESVGRVDTSRVAVLRTGSDFDRPYQGQTDVDNLLNYADQGGFTLATQNLYLAGNPLVQDIVKHWGDWKNGVPAR
ncbi:purine-nucleoside phosphorylase [Burkholderia singularis]|uniref:Purine nucleoside permease n=1 Tax=Burkholderia singularis TaxID=1503053 RepID=A0A238H645_9BURK|nr:purine nucleoside permease [Burkholderia singularis]SMG00650.1 Purine nucleoside permease [Burkholderia singularis]